jgi:hypothetical protein
MLYGIQQEGDENYVIEQFRVNRESAPFHGENLR